MHTPSPPPPAQAALCPLCQQPNACARAAGADGPALDCWCTTQRFGPALLARVPAQARGLACICRACAQAAERDQACR